MSEIPNLMALVKELRSRTGVGIMTCKKALEESNGDIEKAFDVLRAQGEKLARSKGDRPATEGKVVCVTGDHDISMVVVKSETDFVSQGEDFQNFAKKVADVAYENKAQDVDSLLSMPMGDGTVESERVALVGKVGENIQVSDVRYHKEDSGSVGLYSHGDKLACAVFLSKENPQVAKDIGMHVVAMNPAAVTEKDVPAEMIEREKALFETQTASMGKPEFAEKIIQGKMAKFLKEVCLLDQAFVKDPNLTIRDYLKQNETEVLHFIRVELD